MLFVLLHGAYTSPWHWHRVAGLLEDAGHEVLAPELPCDAPEAGIHRYVAEVEGAVGLREEDPVVVGSSLGAVTACVYASRHPVRALVTVCGVVPAPGARVSERGMTTPEFDAALVRNPDRSTTFPPGPAVELVFHDSEPALAAEAARRLRRQAAKPLIEVAPFEALPAAPKLGIVSSTDRILDPGWIARAVRERLGVEPTALACDHAPMLSQPKVIAKLLLAPIGVITIRVPHAHELEAALTLRERVFCGEQGVSRELEFDGLDDSANHLVAVSADGEVLGTLRLLAGNESWRLGRLAVESGSRRRDIGTRLLGAAAQMAAEAGAQAIELHAQTRARGLYEKAGYNAHGTVFDEAGIEHVLMRKDLS